jgi:solute carrier family 45, member 1/2/4
VGEIYYRYEHPAPEPGETDDHDALGNIGRLGSVALVFFSLVTFASSIVIPFFIKAPDGESSFTQRLPPSIPKLVQTIIVNAYEWLPDLTTAWGLSNLLFAFITIFAPFLRSLSSATAMVAACGIPWSISVLAPFALLGMEINKMSSGPAVRINGSAGPGYTAVRGSIDEDEDYEMIEAHPHRRQGSDGVLRVNQPDTGDAHSSTGELAGVYLGVLNVYTTLPQFVGTFISWIVFTIFEPGNKDHDANEDPYHHRYLDLRKNAPNAIAVCMFIGALCSVVSAEAARRLRKLES